MREIKFRAWDKTCNDMEMDVQDVSRKRMIGTSACESFQEVIDSWEFEVMQYTGKKDADGTEIYEGDILVLDMLGGPEKFQVSYSSETAKFGFKDRDGVCWGIGESNVIHVIGNVYANPGLMGEEAE